MGAILKAAGADYKDVVKTTVLLADIADFGAVNAVYGELLPHPFRYSHDDLESIVHTESCRCPPHDYASTWPLLPIRCSQVLRRTEACEGVLCGKGIAARGSGGD